MRLCIVVVVVAAGACRGKEAPLATMDGPEAEDLLPRVSGYIVMDRPVGGLVALSLPHRTELVLRGEGSGQGTVRDVTGPDHEGRIVYVENHMVDEFMRLKTMRIAERDDAERDDSVIFERPGDALWQHAIGAPALAPVGGLVAFVWNATPGHDPDIVGPLELWDISTRREIETGVTATDHGSSWFPDGRRLAYVESVPRPDAESLGLAAADFAADAGEGPDVPVICLFDVEAGTRIRLHVGTDPLVSPGGDALLLRDTAGRWWRMDLGTRQAEPARWPGDWRGPIAWVDDDLLLYWGLPTTGSPVRHTEFGSPLVQRHAMGDVKLGVLGTDRFQTVIQAIDPRRHLSFGTGIE